MTLRDDPRLTAYALGELDERERAEIEALLADDPAARECVDECRRVAGEVACASGVAWLETTPAPRRARRVAFAWVASVAAALLLGSVGATALAPRGGGGRALDATFKSAEIVEFSSTDADWGAAEVKVMSGVRPGSSHQRSQGIGPPGSGTSSPKDDIYFGSAANPYRTYATGSPTGIDRMFIPSAGSGGGAGGVGAGHGDLFPWHGFPGAAGSVPPGVRDPGDPAPPAVTHAGGFLLFSGDADNGDSTEGYAPIEETGFLRPQDAPLSTFSIDVDTASYANVRRFLVAGQRPPPGAVRIEELVNYFRYRYDAPRGSDPFAVHVEVASCPWNLRNRLVKIGLKGREIDRRERPRSNLTFLLDVSGSMDETNKLPLVQESMRLLVNEALEANDQVSIVVYAGASGLVLPPTGGDRRGDVLAAIDRLSAGGSTNGGEGIELAYRTNAEAFLKGGNNRVILCTDGDFNVGVTDRSQLLTLIQEKAKSGIFLTVLGYGMGNLKDDTLELLADKGNGSYGYVDGIREARKVLVEEATGTLFTIAKDVKIQVELNPLQVGQYRLIGYDNRRLAAQDFNDDKKDAGEIGAGHTVTALYEIAPPGGTVEGATVDALRYSRTWEPSDVATRNELLTVKLRYKQPDGDVSHLLEVPVTDAGAPYEKASEDFKFAAAVTAFAMILRDSAFKGTTSIEAVQELAGEALGDDPGGYRKEFLDLVAKARVLGGR